MSFATRTVVAHARRFTALAALSLSSCAPHHGGGGSGGEAGEGGSGAGTAGSAGTTAGGSGSAGGGGSATAGTSAAGTGGTSGSETPATEPVIGCPGPDWPEEGLFYLLGSAADTKTSLFSPTSISGDGRVVGGGTRDPDSPNPRPVPARFSLADGATLLPRLEGGLSNEGFTQRLSCDGSVALANDIFGSTLHRAEGDSAPEIMYGAWGDTLAMDPAGDIVLDGAYDSEKPGPRVWTAAAGAVYLPNLFGTELYHVSPDGTLIGSDFDVLFRYDRSTGVERAIGMAPVSGATSIAFGASGNAWVQSADLHGDSFLLWQLPGQPHSVTCPQRCTPVDLSSTGEVALFNMSSDGSGEHESYLWTKRDGWVALTALFVENGLDVGGGRKLRALGMSDDARVFTGHSFDPSLPFGELQVFYGVLPAAVYD